VLIARWQEGRSPHTFRAYGRDLAHFAQWSEASAAGEAIGRLLAGSMGEANERVHAYRGAILDDGLAPATVNRRLSALRSIIRLGHTFGLIAWSLENEGVKAKAYRDTRGPGVDGVAAVKREAADHASPAKAARDVAIIRVLFDLALRRGEIVGLDLAHFDARAGRLSVLGKGRREREWRTLPPRTLAALKTWLTGSRSVGGERHLLHRALARGQSRDHGAPAWRPPYLDHDGSRSHTRSAQGQAACAARLDGYDHAL